MSDDRERTRAPGTPVDTATRLFAAVVAGAIAILGHDLVALARDDVEPASGWPQAGITLAVVSLAFALPMIAGGAVTAWIGRGLSAGGTRPWRGALAPTLLFGAFGSYVVFELLSGPRISTHRWITALRLGSHAGAWLGSWIAMRCIAALIAGPRGRWRTVVVLVAGGAVVTTLAIADAEVAQTHPRAHLACAVGTLFAGGFIGQHLARGLAKRSRLFVLVVLAPGTVVATVVVVTGRTPGEDLDARALVHTAPYLGQLVGAFPLPRSKGIEPGSGWHSPASPPPDIAVLDAWQPERRKLNVVLVTIDTFRADHAGFMGYERNTTPHLDALARESVVFRRTYSQYGSSQISMGSTHTGLYPSATHLVSDRELGRSASEPTLATFFSGAGHATHGEATFPEAVHAKPMRFIRKGFDDYRNTPGDSKQAVDGALGFVATHPERPFFLWLHLFDAHSPYDPRPDHDFGSNPVALYDAELAAADQQLGRLLEGLRKHPRWESTVVVVHSDHGEGLGDHGHRFHGTNLHEEQVHVPLVMRVPDVPPASVDQPVELVDIARTLTDLCGLTTPPMHGHGLLHWFVPPAHRSAFPRAPAVAFSEMNEIYGTAISVRVGGLTLILDRQNEVYQLYDHAADPGERTNLASRRPEDVRRLAGYASGYANLVDTPIDHLLEQLESTETSARWLALIGLLARGEGDAAARHLTRMALDRTRNRVSREEAILDLTTLTGSTLAATATQVARFAALPDAGLRARTALLIARLAPDAEGTQAVLQRLSNDDVAIVATAAVVARALRGDERALARLKTDAGDLQGELRILGVVALARAGDEASLALLRSLPGALPLRADLETHVASAAARHQLTDYLVHVYARMTPGRFPVPTHPSAIGEILRYDATIALPVWRRLLFVGMRTATERHVTTTRGADTVAGLRAIDHDVIEAWHRVRLRRPVNHVMAALANARQRARQEGYEEWGVLIDTWAACVRGRTAQSAADSVRRLPGPPDGAALAALRIRDRIVSLGNASIHPPKGRMTIRHADADLRFRPPGFGRSPWVLELEISLDSDSGTLLGGRDGVRVTVRFKESRPGGGRADPVSQPLPITGVLPGETLPFVLPFEMDIPPGRWTVEVSLEQDGAALAGFDSARFERSATIR